MAIGQWNMLAQGPKGVALRLRGCQHTIKHIAGLIALSEKRLKRRIRAVGLRHPKIHQHRPLRRALERLAHVRKGARQKIKALLRDQFKGA